MHGDGVSGDGDQLEVELVRGSQVRHHVQAGIALGWQFIWNMYLNTVSYKQEVTCKVLGVEEEEGGLASELVRGEEHLLVANQAGADKGRRLLTRQHLEEKI